MVSLYTVFNLRKQFHSYSLFVIISGMPAETVGESAAASLVTDIQSGGCVDSYLQDQVKL